MRKISASHFCSKILSENLEYGPATKIFLCTDFVLKFVCLANSPHVFYAQIFLHLSVENDLKANGGMGTMLHEIFFES